MAYPSLYSAQIFLKTPHILTTTVRIVAALIAAIGVFAFIASYPLDSTTLLIVLSLYVALLWRYPRAPWVLIPAMLPILDFSPLTGRFFFDEFDMLLLATAGLALFRKRAVPDFVRLPTIARTLLGLFAISILVAAIRTAWPLQWPDLNTFNNYNSPLNGLRAAKGFLWAVVFMPIIKREIADDARSVYRLLIYGMVLGAAMATTAILAERAAFPGLFDFTSDYRVVGPFFAMHNGGAYIEGYLVLSLPFVAWFVVMQQRWWWRVAGLLIFLLGSYCMVVTYARGGYFALLIALTVLALISVSVAKAAQFKTSVGLMTLFFALFGLASVPVLRDGGYMAGRFSTSQSDLVSRAAQWRHGIALMGDQWTARLIGVGAGTYPRLSAASSISNKPSTYLFGREGQRNFLQLTAGSPLYFEQILSITPKDRYQITVSVRANHPDATLAIPVCEKWLLYSRNCFSKSILVGDTGGEWKKFSIDMQADWLSAPAWYALRPIKFSIFNEGDGTLDITNVSTALDGVELLKNGDFAQSMDHWYFSTERFENWHLENTWLQLYFEQGAVGLLLFISLLACAALAVWLKRGQAAFPIAPIVAALTGFLALGVLDSLFDFPRLGFIFYILIFVSVLGRR